MKTINKLYCPICGKEMCADIHAPEDGAKWNSTFPDISTEEFRKMDNWICMNNIDNHCVVFVREDIDEWTKDLR